MRIVIATTQVPFVHGGAEEHAKNLQNALMSHGHEVEIAAIPFKWYPPEKIVDTMLACRLMDLSESCGNPIDRVIGLKFPAYLMPHPNKVLWILHQHRTAYDLWDHPLGDLIHFPNGACVRDAIRKADKNLIPRAKKIFANSANVSKRLMDFCDIKAQPLYHPPPGEDLFHCLDAEDYLFFPSRLSTLKRQTLVLEALAKTRHRVCVCFAGSPDTVSYGEDLKKTAAGLKIDHRVQWPGFVSNREKIELYARARGVIYPPLDEDYGYVTLEAMLSSKPVITCLDSGGPMEFVLEGETGLISEPTPESLALAMDRIWENPEKSKTWGKNGLSHYQSLGISWSHVVERLLA